MKTVISASRRTDLVGRFPRLAGRGPGAGDGRRSGRPAARTRTVDLRPDSVHTIVLWSKDFSQPDPRPARAAARPATAIDQTLFPVHDHGAGRDARRTGRAPRRPRRWPSSRGLVDLAGDPRRVSLRFDPVVIWREGGARRDATCRFFRDPGGRGGAARDRGHPVQLRPMVRKAASAGPGPEASIFSIRRDERKGRGGRRPGRGRPRGGLRLHCLRPDFSQRGPRTPGFGLHRRPAPRRPFIRAASRRRTAKDRSPAAGLRLHGVGGYREL